MRHNVWEACYSALLCLMGDLSGKIMWLVGVSVQSDQTGTALLY